MGGKGYAVALASTRVFAYLLLGYGLFHLAFHFGKWYDEKFQDEGEGGLAELAFVLSGEGDDEILIRNSRAQLFFFLACPIVLAAALGGVYEALWMSREAKAASSEAPTTTSLFSRLHSLVHLQFRPLGSSFFP